MSVEAMAAVFNAAIPIISPLEKYVLLALANYADHNGLKVYPSVNTVAAVTGLSRATVQRSIGNLQRAGLLILVAEARQHSPRKYRIALDALRRLRRVNDDDRAEGQRGGHQAEAPQIQEPQTGRQEPHRERQGRQGEAQSVINRQEPSVSYCCDSTESDDDADSGQNTSWASYIESLGADKSVLSATEAAIAKTRKTGKVSQSSLDGLARKMSQYPADIVVRACRKYAEQDHAAEGRGEAYLLGMIRAMAKRPTTSCDGHAEVTEVLDAYTNAFAEKYGKKPLIQGGKDRAIIKRILTTYGKEQLLMLLTSFFASNDPFIERTGRTIAIFQATLNQLIIGTGGKRTSIHDRWTGPDAPSPGWITKGMFARRP